MNERGRPAPGDGLPVLVVGGGFAGVAAAWSAARAGAEVVLVHGVSGASALYSGIVDGDRASREARELGRGLGLHIGEPHRAVATREGVVRPALGWDSALLDLDAVAGRRIGVADVGRDDFDAELLARVQGDQKVKIKIEEINRQQTLIRIRWGEGGNLNRSRRLYELIDAKVK